MSLSVQQIAGDRVLEESWEAYTISGNQFMQASQFSQAHEQYFEAMAIAACLLSDNGCYHSKPKVVHLYVVSCQNLSDSFMALDQSKPAKRMVEQACSEMIRLMNNTALPMEFRVEASKALKAASFEAYRFYYEQEQLDQAEKTIQAAIAQSQIFFAMAIA
jgi:tetratricopeptide (TPR) repeat protein